GCPFERVFAENAIDENHPPLANVGRRASYRAVRPNLVSSRSTSRREPATTRNRNLSGSCGNRAYLWSSGHQFDGGHLDRCAGIDCVCPGRNKKHETNP